MPVEQFGSNPLPVFPPVGEDVGRGVVEGDELERLQTRVGGDVEQRVAHRVRLEGFPENKRHHEVHGQHRGRLFLPFADDDPKCAEILSKVLLLARDDRIKDPSLLDQLRQTL